MLTYWILICLTLFGFLVRGERNCNLYFIFVSIVLILISSLRGEEVGGDLNNYLPLFKDIERSWSETLTYDKYGLIFKLYIKLSTLISGNTTWLLFTTSLFNLIIPLRFMKKHSKSIWLSLFIYITMSYYTNTFNSIRSSMSLACGMIVVDCLLEGKKKWAFLWALISVEIHKSMFPIFILFFLINKKPTIWKLTIPIISSIIIANVVGLTPFTSILNAYYDDGMLSRMDFSEMSSKGYTLLTMDIAILYISFFMMRKKMTDKDGFFINLFMIATCLQAGAPMFSLITRMAFFFSVYMTVILPNALSYIKPQQVRRLCISAMMIICLAFFKITVMTPADIGFRNSNSQCTIPYYFIWENLPKL